ncbi:hypothetical protein [Nocardia wallacei]|uniref:hypothetical protein n=1 Tax=Nocardia wallacei TaxID=480035 RepID=UPI0024590875|nr:hypothetical protein [Nocardia wallacei]
MSDPTEPWRVPHMNRNEELERRSRRVVEHATRDSRGREIEPDASAPRGSAAYRAAVARDLMARGIDPPLAATLVMLGNSWPAAAGVAAQAGSVTEQAEATRARTREVQEREVREREAAERLRRATRGLDVGYGRERFEREQ